MSCKLRGGMIGAPILTKLEPAARFFLKGSRQNQGSLCNADAISSCDLSALPFRAPRARGIWLTRAPDRRTGLGAPSGLLDAQPGGNNPRHGRGRRAGNA